MTNPAAAEAAIAPQPEPQSDSNPLEQPDGFTLWAVLRRDPGHSIFDAGDNAPDSEGDLAAELNETVEALQEQGVTVRGFYDASGLKADADLMIWMHGPIAETLQWALRQLRRSRMLASLLPTWNAMGVHRGAEFNKAHIPAFLQGEEPRRWLTVYPFVRSYDWYLLPDEDRARMLSDHGRKGSAFRGVLANTVSAFALGDYEWLLPMESDTLTDLVDLMRDLRATEARLHVREEIPFFTGRRIETAEIPEVLR